MLDILEITRQIWMNGNSELVKALATSSSGIPDSMRMIMHEVVLLCEILVPSNLPTFSMASWKIGDDEAILAFS